jgi:hypothetical protein
MKVHVKGKGQVTLPKRDFVSSGGEGDIYAKGRTAYKIYHEPSKVIPEGKFNELAAITDDNVIKPQQLVLDGKGKVIGYTMRFMPKTYALCQLFPRIFRDRYGLTRDTVLELVLKMQKCIGGIHKAGVLIVDLNELNFLVSQDFADIFFIDVDSYQTRHYPATAIMPSVRDWKVKLGDFTANSDWFSFAIVSFQMFIGIHPFKGKHPSVKGLEERMQQGISVFDKHVKLPKVCYPLDSIPDAYRQWYKAVLHEGKRLPPPTSSQPVVCIPLQPLKILDSKVLDINKLFKHHQPIGQYWYSSGVGVVRGPGGVALETTQKNTLALSAGTPAVVGFTPKRNHVMVFHHNNHMFNLTTGKEVPITFRADESMCYDGRIYFRNGDQMLEVDFYEGGNDSVLISTKIAANVMENASRLFDGVVMQNMLGSTIATVFPRSGASYSIKLPELDKLRIVDAKFDSGVLMVTTHQGKGSGRYSIHTFRFDAEYKTYDTWFKDNITPMGLNFVVLDTGVCISLVEDENMEVFRSRKDSATLQTIKDQSIGTDMLLTKHAGKAAFFRGQDMYQLSMKKK